LNINFTKSVFSHAISRKTLIYYVFIDFIYIDSKDIYKRMTTATHDLKTQSDLHNIEEEIKKENEELVNPNAKRDLARVIVILNTLSCFGGAHLLM